MMDERSPLPFFCSRSLNASIKNIPHFVHFYLTPSLCSRPKAEGDFVNSSNCSFPMSQK